MMVFQGRLIVVADGQRVICANLQAQLGIRGGTKTKRKDYAFRRQVEEKPSIIPGCLVASHHYLACIVD